MEMFLIKADVYYLEDFFSAPTSRRMLNTQIVQDD